MPETDNNDFIERMQRIETLVGEMQQAPDPTLRAHAQELVQTLLELHRAAFEKLIAQMHQHSGLTPQSHLHASINGHDNHDHGKGNGNGNAKANGHLNDTHVQSRGGQEIDLDSGRLANRFQEDSVGSRGQHNVYDSTANQPASVGQSVLDAAARDKLLSSVLLLHDLHPWDLRTRIQYALDQEVRPYLRSEGADAELLHLDTASVDGSAADDGEPGASIKVNEPKQGLGGHDGGGGCGCGSSGPDDLKEAIRNAVRDWAPELGEIDIQGVTDEPKTEPGLVQLTIAHGK